jgi:hypothetical protein
VVRDLGSPLAQPPGLFLGTPRTRKRPTRHTPAPTRVRRRGRPHRRPAGHRGSRRRCRPGGRTPSPTPRSTPGFRPRVCGSWGPSGPLPSVARVQSAGRPAGPPAGCIEGDPFRSLADRERVSGEAYLPWGQVISERLISHTKSDCSSGCHSPASSTARATAVSLPLATSPASSRPSQRSALSGCVSAGGSELPHSPPEPGAQVPFLASLARFFCRQVPEILSQDGAWLVHTVSFCTPCMAV